MRRRLYIIHYVSAKHRSILRAPPAPCAEHRSISGVRSRCARIRLRRVYIQQDQLTLDRLGASAERHPARCLSRSLGVLSSCAVLG